MLYIIFFKITAPIVYFSSVALFYYALTGHNQIQDVYLLIKKVATFFRNLRLPKVEDAPNKLELLDQVQAGKLGDLIQTHIELKSKNSQLFLDYIEKTRVVEQYSIQHPEHLKTIRNILYRVSEIRNSNAEDISMAAADLREARANSVLSPIAEHAVEESRVDADLSEIVPELSEKRPELDIVEQLLNDIKEADSVLLDSFTDQIDVLLSLL